MAQSLKKQAPWTPRGPNFYDFSPNMSDFSVKFYLCKYHLTPVKRKKKKELGLHLWFMQFGCNFKLVLIYVFCPPNLFTKNVKTKIGKSVFLNSVMAQSMFEQLLHFIMRTAVFAWKKPHKCSLFSVAALQNI